MSADINRLSPRQFDTLIATAEGLTSKEMAKRFKISPKTVEQYRQAVRDRLQISSTAGLTRYAISLGLTLREAP